MNMHSRAGHRAVQHERPRHRADPAAGVMAGALAAAAYLAAQLSFSVLFGGGSGPEPLQRIAAILLGPDAAPPPAELSPTIVGIGLLIHFLLGMLYGQWIEWLTRGSWGVGAALRGAAAGAAVFVVNFWLIAPSSFPWFGDSPAAVTFLDHLLFGAVAGYACDLLRRRRARD